MKHINIDQVLKSYCNQVQEHTNADSVQIIITTSSNDNKTSYSIKGSGNWFARKGVLQSCIKDMEGVEEDSMLFEPADDEEPIDGTSFDDDDDDLSFSKD